MQQEHGLRNSLKIKQMYIQLERNGASTVYSFPAIIMNGTNLDNNLKKNPPIVSDIYHSCKQKSVQSYSEFDIAESRFLRATVCYPIKENGKFIGAMIWESQADTTFEEVIIPNSFLKKQYPFIQFRLP